MIARLLSDVLLSLAAGAAFAELIPLRLRLIERSLIVLVAALVLAPAITYALALLFGLNVATVLLGPALLFVACAALVLPRADPLGNWRVSVQETLLQLRSAPSRLPWVMAAVTVFASIVFGLLFAHTLFMQHSDLTAGFQTVWADWSQHLTTANSFAVAGNTGGTNPLFAGTPLLYPFIADLQSAGLVTLGLSPEASLAIPGAMLAVAIALLVIRLAARLGLGVGAGIIAAAITFIGGGLGFAGVFADACHAAGATAAQCTLTHVFGNLGDGVRVAAGTLGHIPAVIAAQPRAYDGLLTEAANLPFPDMQWYTPLFAWWLPQRTILYGFATALTVLLLVFTALVERSRALPVFIAAGVLVGVLPLVHAQTFIALAIVLVVIALFNLRREWLVLGGVAGVIALPRLVQIALAPHGSPAFGNAYPWLEPGWLSNAVPHTPPRGVLELFGYGVGGGIRSLLSPSWWGFWFINLGVAVPLSLATVVVAALRLVPGATAAFAKRVLSPFPEPLLQLVIAASLVFLLCNVVVLQSWDWDNTKLFAFWYLAAGLLIAATASWLWRRGVLRRIGASLLVTMTLLTGVVVLLRFVPWTPPQNAVGGPYTLASADERSLAAALVARTPGDAVFLTYGRPNDPVLAVAGRTGLLGYYGWLWSYGIDFGTRVTDVQTMYRGCAQQTDCPVPALLRKYHVSFVEIDDRADSPGAIEAHVDAAWWSSQGFPVVARSQHIVVYDVRRL